MKLKIQRFFVTLAMSALMIIALNYALLALCHTAIWLGWVEV